LIINDLRNLPLSKLRLSKVFAKVHGSESP
jgi:hypothetical protein